MRNCETLEKMLKMSPDDRRKAGKVVARSFYKILRKNGFTHGDIMNFAGDLLDGVIREIEKEKRADKSSREIDTREMATVNGSREVA